MTGGTGRKGTTSADGWVEPAIQPTAFIRKAGGDGCAGKSLDIRQTPPGMARGGRPKRFGPAGLVVEM